MATHWAMRTRKSTLADRLREVEVSSRYTGQCAHAGRYLADTLAEVQAVGDTRGDMRALVNSLADTVAVREAVTLSDARHDAYALI